MSSDFNRFATVHFLTIRQIFLSYSDDHRYNIHNYFEIINIIITHLTELVRKMMLRLCIFSEEIPQELRVISNKLIFVLTIHGNNFDMDGDFLRARGEDFKNLAQVDEGMLGLATGQNGAVISPDEANSLEMTTHNFVGKFLSEGDDIFKQGQEIACIQINCEKW